MIYNRVANQNSCRWKENVKRMETLWASLSQQYAMLLEKHIAIIKEFVTAPVAVTNWWHYKGSESLLSQTFTPWNNIL